MRINALTPTIQLLLLELNEVNFEAVEFHTQRGELPTFRRLFERHGYRTTISGAGADHWEPWIQWVTAHTGLDYSEHQVFRLGDIVDRDIPQVWERLEAVGYRVGAISPMNAKLLLKKPAFFFPDPWTATGISAAPGQKQFYEAIARLVNENASNRVSMGELLNFVIGGLKTAKLGNYTLYLALIASARTQRWKRALFLDLLLADLFMTSLTTTRPHFASLFLNAAGHVQHHYLFSSAAYIGEQKNPRWYVAEGADPVLDAYKLYDRILARFQSRFPETRIMLATGLHQEPHDKVTFYWRLKDHAAFLDSIGVIFQRTEPRMSRDFLVVCRGVVEALKAQERLELARASDGTFLFEVDNRGSNLFVTFVYKDDICETITYSAGSATVGQLRRQVAFVAIKNGDHNGIGYFLDTGVSGRRERPPFPLRNLPDMVVAAMT